MTNRLFIACPGPSLPAAVELLREADARVMVVNDAFRLFPRAVCLVASDVAWWKLYEDDLRLQMFRGLKVQPIRYVGDEAAEGVHTVLSAERTEFLPEFSCGSCGLFAAISLALTWQERELVLIGADMAVRENKTHFFGSHPSGLRETRDFGPFINELAEAAARLPAGVQISNATRGSALKAFPFRELQELLP
jgi:hypothetical protein